MKRNLSALYRHISHFGHYWLPVILYAGVTFSLSSLPGAAYPDAPLETDKLLHMLEYALFAFLLYRALAHSPKSYLFKYAFGLSILVSSFFGLTGEFQQLFVPGRSFELADIFSNVFGSIVAAIGYRSELL